MDAIYAERLLMTYSPILGVEYGLVLVDITEELETKLTEN